MKKTLLIPLLIFALIIVTGCVGTTRQKMISAPDSEDDACTKWCERGVDSDIDDTKGKTKQTLKASEICECGAVTAKVDKMMDTEPQEIEPAVLASKTAKYKIEFMADWSAATHPNDYPADAHFSPFVAYSHSNTADAKIFVKGGSSTLGMEDMAETGAFAKLKNEIQSIINTDRAHGQTNGKRIDSPGKDSSTLEFTQSYGYLTFVSMLAPSPDWFVSASTQLFKNGQWVESVELDLITYDAGTDSGPELTSPDQDTNPKEPIAVFTKNLQGLGRIVITKVE